MNVYLKLYRGLFLDFLLNSTIAYALLVCLVQDINPLNWSYSLQALLSVLVVVFCVIGLTTAVMGRAALRDRERKRKG